MRIDTLNRSILALALPAIVSNITVPLLGLVDTGIAGHLGKSTYIGAIAVGGVIFNMVYWLFAFLRWGTSGLTAQAYGAGRQRDISYTLYRSCLMAAMIATVLVVLQRPLFYVISQIMDVDNDIARYTTAYFRICIWGAWPVILLYSLTGWFVGMQNSRIPMVIAIVQNGTNIPLSLFFVFGLGMKIEGVALGTVIAQYLGLLAALLMLWSGYRHYLQRPLRGELFRADALLRFLRVNRDLLLRMVCLLSVTTWFTSAGVRQGDLILAANGILLQLFYLVSYFFDGFANAGEAMCGRFWGARDPANFVGTVKRVFLWGLALVAIFTLLFALAERPLLRLMTDQEAVVETAHSYFHWLLLIPLAGLFPFVWDGVFVGATSTRHLLLSMFVGTVVFFLAYALLFPSFGNDGLWLSFLLYLIGRGMTQQLTFRRVLRPLYD